MFPYDDVDVIECKTTSLVARNLKDTEAVENVSHFCLLCYERRRNEFPELETKQISGSFVDGAKVSSQQRMVVKREYSVVNEVSVGWDLKRIRLPSVMYPTRSIRRQ